MAFAASNPGRSCMIVQNEALVDMAVNEELRDSKRMAIIGKLSQSVAHDINNLLSGILGYSELLLEEAPEGNSKSFVNEILKAGQRISALTRILLVFRKSDYRPGTLNINEPIAGLRKFLPRLVGSRSDLSVSMEPALWSVHVDSVCISRMVLVLATFAGEILPENGRCSFVTKNVSVPGDSTDTPPLDAGRYVQLSTELEGITDDSRTEPEEALANSDLTEIVRLCGGRLICARQPGGKFSVDVYLSAVIAR